MWYVIEREGTSHDQESDSSDKEDILDECSAKIQVCLLWFLKVVSKYVPTCARSSLFQVVQILWVLGAYIISIDVTSTCLGEMHWKNPALEKLKRACLNFFRKAYISPTNHGHSFLVSQRCLFLPMACTLSKGNKYPSFVVGLIPKK